MQIWLNSCVKHPARIGVPRCFYNYGGSYKVVRYLWGEMVLLQHVKSLNVGIARETDLRLITEPTPAIPVVSP